MVRAKCLFHRLSEKREHTRKNFLQFLQVVRILKGMKTTLREYVTKIYNVAVVARFESIYASKGAAEAVEYAIRMLDRNSKHVKKLQSLAAAEKNVQDLQDAQDVQY